VDKNVGYKTLVNYTLNKICNEQGTIQHALIFPPA